jgi:hypothetical protein
MGCGPGPLILRGNFVYLATTEPTQESDLPIVNEGDSFV